jgi:hypothetical protein
MPVPESDTEAAEEADLSETETGDEAEPSESDAAGMLKREGSDFPLTEPEECTSPPADGFIDETPSLAPGSRLRITEDTVAVEPFALPSSRGERLATVPTMVETAAANKTSSRVFFIQIEVNVALDLIRYKELEVGLQHLMFHWESKLAPV